LKKLSALNAMLRWCHVRIVKDVLSGDVLTFPTVEELEIMKENL